MAATLPANRGLEQTRNHQLNGDVTDTASTRARPHRLILVVVLLLLIGVAGAVSYLFAFRHHTGAMKRVCQNGYCVTMPSAWRYRDASYPSDHATYYYWNPDNALEQLVIVQSGCVGCVTKNNDGIHPDPSGEFPLNVTAQREVSPYEIRYRAYGTRSPYPTDGFVYVTHTDKGIDGSIIFALDLPETKTPLAERIIDSFVLQG